MEDLSGIAQIVSNLTITSWAIYAWMQERKERQQSQRAHNKDLREVAKIAKGGD